MSILNGRINYIKSYYDIILNNINLKGLFFYLDCAQVFIILYFLHWEETLDSLFVLIQKKKRIMNLILKFLYLSWIKNECVLNNEVEK